LLKIHEKENNHQLDHQRAGTLVGSQRHSMGSRVVRLKIHQLFLSSIIRSLLHIGILFQGLAMAIFTETS
jgi:hypothetical protein